MRLEVGRRIEIGAMAEIDINDRTIQTTIAQKAKGFLRASGGPDDARTGIFQGLPNLVRQIEIILDDKYGITLQGIADHVQAAR